MRNENGCLSLAGVVQVVLVILKLVGAIDWKWRYVLLPFILTVVINVSILLYYKIKFR